MFDAYSLPTAESTAADLAALTSGYATALATGATIMLVGALVSLCTLHVARDELPHDDVPTAALA